MSTFLQSLSDYFTLPMLVGLLIGVFLVIIKIVLTKKPDDDDFIAKHEELPPMPKRDFTVAELKHFNGVKDPRILLAVNGKVFDVTSGKQNYGPGMSVFILSYLIKNYKGYIHCFIKFALSLCLTKRR